MPIYEYQCTTCAHRFELKQSMKDDPIRECPRCGKDVTKLISSPAIMFKGSGWYITDYSDKMKPGAGNESSEKPAPSAADKTKTPALSETGGAAPAPAPTAAPSTPSSTSTTTSAAGTPSSQSSDSKSSSSSAA